MPRPVNPITFRDVHRVEFVTVTGQTPMTVHTPLGMHRVSWHTGVCTGREGTPEA